MGGSVKYIDPDIFGFLNRLEENGGLNDTTIIMLSDHGQHLSTYPSVIADHFNPLLMVYLPKNIN
jgi:arylsulfatase A-like enzyme